MAEYEKLFNNIRYCANLITRVLCQNTNNSGLFHGQASILVLISENEFRSQKELADIAGMRPASLSEVLDKLESRNLIKRLKNDADKRTVNISLTAEGKIVVNDMGGFNNELTGKILKAITLSEVEQMSEIVEKLNESLEKECKKDGDCGKDSKGKSEGKGNCKKHGKGKVFGKGGKGGNGSGKSHSESQGSCGEDSKESCCSGDDHDHGDKEEGKKHCHGKKGDK